MFLWRTMSISASAAAFLALAGCNTSGSLKTVEASCVGQYKTYNDAWNCARNQNNVSYDDYRSRYIANGDVLAAQVSAGQVSDSSARASMSNGFAGGGGGRR
jgi:hypothetical protein